MTTNTATKETACRLAILDASKQRMNPKSKMQREFLQILPGYQDNQTAPLLRSTSLWYPK